CRFKLSPSLVTTLFPYVSLFRSPLMARFCHLDKRLENTLRQCVRLEDEASPDVCLAEIVFIPDDRMGNVMLRHTSGDASSSSRRAEEHTSELQSRDKIVCRLLLA